VFKYTHENFAVIQIIPEANQHELDTILTNDIVGIH